MLTNVISSFGLKKGKVLKLISWKHSFKRLNEEYEIAKKKKHALDNLFENGRMSQSTRDSFDTDINAVIMEIEKQQKDLLIKMHGKSQELESQIKTLETLLANYEIQHVVGEIDEEMYQREITLLSTGLESARNELNIIKEATNQLCPPVEAPTTEPALPVEENEVEAVQSETVENVSDAPVEVEVAAEPCSQEPVVTMEEAVPEAPAIESAYIAPEETPQIVEEAPEVIENQPEMTEEMPQTAECTPQEIVEDQPQVTEDIAQDIAEAPELTEDNAEITEEISQDMNETLEVTEDSVEVTDEMPQVTEDTPQDIEEQPQFTEETLESNDEKFDVAAEQPDYTEDLSQNIEETVEQPEIIAEIPQIVENEPQLIEETLQTAEETPAEAHPSEAPKEAPQEVIVETVAEEEQSTEEAAETADSDEDTEYEEL
jgi:hypothetical protein